MSGSVGGDDERRNGSAGDVRTSRLLVVAQFVLLGLLALLPFGSDWPRPGWLILVASVAALAGMALVAAGAAALGPGLTPSPLPNARARLRTDGVYRYVRHPIYSGLLLVAAAVVAVSGSLVRVVLYGLLLGLLHRKARWEERRLSERFPEYGPYAARTPRFVPRVLSGRSRRGSTG